MAGSVDPKEILLNNKALLVTYVIAIVPIVLYFVVVGGLADEVAAKQMKLKRSQNTLKGFFGQLKDPENPLYTETDKERLTARKAAWEKELSALDEVVKERDAPLERWFERFKGQDEPEFNDYVTEWSQNKIPALVSEYSDLLGTSGQALLFVDVPGRSELRAFQKKYWIQEAVLQALRAGGIERLVSPGISFEAPRASGGGAFVVHPVRLTVRCKFTKLPGLIKQLLSTELTTKVKRVRVSKAAFEIQRPNLTINGSRKVFLDYAYGEQIPEGDPVPEKPSEVIGEPAVNVEIALEVYDFGEKKQ